MYSYFSSALLHCCDESFALLLSITTSIHVPMKCALFQYHPTSCCELTVQFD